MELSMSPEEKDRWYVTGLHFECLQCGNCCSGPEQGYVWITRPEIELVAEFLDIPIGELRRKYLKRVGMRTTVIEQQGTRDCAFLQKIDGQKRCTIYSVRPSQCRNWPFWPGNLTKPNEWNLAARKCPGINRGKLHSCKSIEKIKKDKKWWLKRIQNQK
jgi:Fe-S-cluster containining protein